MEPRDSFPNRRDVLTATLASAAFGGAQAQEPRAQEAPREVFLERAAEGTPHKGKVLLAVQAHSDDIPLSAAGTVAKLVTRHKAYFSLGSNNTRVYYLRPLRGPCARMGRGRTLGVRNSAHGVCGLQ